MDEYAAKYYLERQDLAHSRPDSDGAAGGYLFAQIPALQKATDEAAQQRYLKMTTTDKNVINNGKDRDDNVVLRGRGNTFTVPEIRDELIRLHREFGDRREIRNLRTERRLKELKRWNGKANLAQELASARRAVFAVVGQPAPPAAQGSEAWTWNARHRTAAIKHPLLGHGCRGPGRVEAQSFTLGVAASPAPTRAPTPQAPAQAEALPGDAAALRAELAAMDARARHTSVQRSVFW